ncbi:MAG: hypothetical protein R3E88_02875 [Myxococcota bacterium]
MARNETRPEPNEALHERVLFTAIAIAWIGAMLLALIALATWGEAGDGVEAAPPSDAIAAELLVPTAPLGGRGSVRERAVRHPVVAAAGSPDRRGVVRCAAPAIARASVAFVELDGSPCVPGP